MIKEKVVKRLKTKKLENFKILFLKKKKKKKKQRKNWNPGYQVVNSVNFHTYNISRYQDYNLQRVVKEIPSYQGHKRFYSKT